MHVGLPHARMGWGAAHLQGQVMMHHHCLHSSSSAEQAQPQKGSRAHVADLIACANDTQHLGIL